MSSLRVLPVEDSDHGVRIQVTSHHEMIDMVIPTDFARLFAKAVVDAADIIDIERLVDEPPLQKVDCE